MKGRSTKLAARMAGMLTETGRSEYRLPGVSDHSRTSATTKVVPIRWKGPETFVMTKNTPNKDTVFRHTIDSLGAEWSSDEQRASRRCI